MTNHSKPIIGATLAIALMSTSAFAASGGGGGSTTAPNASSTPTNVSTPRPATTTTPTNAGQNTIMRDPAPGKGKANPPHIVQRGNAQSHTTTSPNGNGNPG